MNKEITFVATRALGLIVFSVSACGMSSSEQGVAASAVASVSSTEWRAYQPNRSHVVLFEVVDNASISHHAMVCDLGEAAFPSNKTLPAKFESAEYLNDGKTIRCKAVSGGHWNFILDVQNTSGAEETIGDIGNSDLTDEAGWDMSLVAGSSAGDAWNLLATNRVRDPGPAPVEWLCTSGGPGSTSCSQTSGNSACSVGCGAGYYACCNQGVVYNTCACLK